MGHILDKRAKHSCEPMTKKDMIYYCNRVRVQYMLGSEEQWPLNGSLNYYMISQLEMFCKRAGKRDEIPYVEAFMLLHQEEKESEGCHLMVQRSERKPKGEPILQGEEGENESGGMLFQNLNLPLAYTAPPMAEQAAPAVVPTALRPTPPTYSPPPISLTHGDQIVVSMLTPGAQEPGLVSPSKTRQSTQFGPGAVSAAGQFPLLRYPLRGPGTPLDLRCPILIFPQEPPGNIDSEE